MFYVGSYIRIVTRILDAAMVSGQNVVLIGAPGWGKTDISQSYLEQVTNGRYNFTRIEQSTDPIVLKGAIDPDAYFKGKGLVKVVSGTPYEVGIQATLLDEAGRGNNPVFDIILDIADRRDIPRDERHPVIITTNFMPTDERTRAMRDRFPIWLHLPEPSDFDTDAIIDSQSVPGGPRTDISGSPSLVDALRYRAMLPSANAVTAVKGIIRELMAAGKTEGFNLNPRRVTQWYNILFHVSAWRYDSNDFDTVHPLALEILGYCWPAMTADEADRFNQFAMSTINRGQAAADRCKARIFKALDALVNARQKTPRLIQEASVSVQSAQDELRHVLGEDDPIFIDISNKTTTWIANAIQGKPIE